MKKAYNKPLLIVERFALSQTIATGCGENVVGEPLHTRTYNCAWDMGGVIILQTTEICGENASDVWDFVCYNAPEPSMSIFHS